MARNNLVIIGGLAALAIIVAVVVGYAVANPYGYQNMVNNGGQCPGQTGGSGYGMMSGGMMGGMMGGNHMTGYGGMQCPYHQNGYYNFTNTIAIVNYGFHPQNVTVKVGTTITWINMDMVTHSVTSNTGLFDSDLNHMQSFSYTFNAPGTYAYHCDPHPYMTGTVVVQV